ncbi:MAG TPA: tetraacyldisaccharide 4'-kinase [Rhizomicrobium sp.]|nr:tetraacyldisaccharide 4'-kinase [Rhizomicrobium sp.]
MRAPEFWTKKDGSSRAISDALRPIGWIVGKITVWRANRHWRYRARARVICVGNLTVGGTGKTPVAIAIAELLAQRNIQPFFLSRGYGGRLQGPVLVDVKTHSAREVGDEPLLLANTCPTVVSRSRAAGAEFADRNGADVIVMDDGHQNSELRKHISFVVVDAQAGFGNRRVLPAGPLREPIKDGLKRASAVILVGGDENAKITGYPGKVFRAKLVPQDIPGLRERPVIAFAGIGQPRKLLQSLRELGAQVKAMKAFPDHHIYTGKEISALQKKAMEAGALLLTTEKDYVRLPPNRRRGIAFLPVRAVFEEPEALQLFFDRFTIPSRQVDFA